MRVSVVLSALALLWTFALGSAALASDSSGEYSTHEELSARLQLPPFNATTRDAIVQSLRVSMSTYAFTSLARDSSIGAPQGAQFTQQNIDLMAEINKLAETTFQSAYEMEEAFAWLFRSLNDAHTMYIKSTAGIGLLLPFDLQVRVLAKGEAADPDQQAVFLKDRPEYELKYAHKYDYPLWANITDARTGRPAQLSSIDGFQVTHINGSHALAHLWSMANDETPFRVGWSKDPHARFNLLTSGFTADEGGLPGLFAFRNLAFDAIPDGPVPFTLRDTITNHNYSMIAHWVVVSLQTSTLLAEQLQQPIDPLLRAQQMQRKFHSLISLQHPAVAEQQEHHAEQAARVGAGERVLGFIADQISFVVLSDNTGVLRIWNFEHPTKAFFNVLQQSVTQHQHEYNGTRLIIDLRANGGGDICLGYAVLRFLFPQLELPYFSHNVASDSPFGRYDFPQSPATLKLAQAGAANLRQFPINNACDYWTPCEWLRADTQTSYTNLSWYEAVPARSALRGSASQPVALTSLVHDDCTAYFRASAPSGVNPGYAASQVVVVTDGLCGSTCAVFSSFIQMNALGKTVAMGGVVDSATRPSARPMQPWSFPGGQIIHLDGENGYRALAATYGLSLDDPLVPGAYPNGATQSWAIREIYPWMDTEGRYPLEYLHVPADFHFGYTTNSTDASGIYHQLIFTRQLFAAGTCVAGVDDVACDTPNGSAVRACVNNQLQAACTAQTCHAGYYLFVSPNGLSSCEACGVGTYRTAADEQSACTPCLSVANLTLADSVQCTGRFMDVAVVAATCPYTYVCSSVAISSSGKSSSTSLYIALGVLIPLVLALLAGGGVLLKQRNDARRMIGSMDSHSPYVAMRDRS